jgi:hypothetical protein
VRSVEEARDLQTASKALDRWRLVMELQIHRTLLETGHFHVDDLDALDLPPEAFEVRGTLVNAIRRTDVMESTGIYRKVAHAAANARKAPIYRITEKGRKELVGMGGGNAVDSPRTVPAASGHSSHSGDSSGAGVQPPQGADRSRIPTDDCASTGAPDPSPEPLSLLPEPDPKAWAA